ncbi:MAG: RNA 2',3'-cyclic phosphodiesterase [Candidatus Thermoplasmatota archaeon]|jgi:2'-5' RNA ligase|nr:RNA 2',3'-cyclic phosphodiesterase [Candidatus Thermoplasmatota archaeon]
MVKFRGFIAVDVPLNKKLLDMENEIKNTQADLKLVEPENIHVTLKFLGDTDEEKIDEIQEIIKNSVKDINAFDIKLKGSGVFPNKNYMKVIWVGLENAKKLQEIAKKLDKQLENLGFKAEKRDFAAHLTIARVKSSKNKEKLLQILEKYQDVEFAVINVNSVKLKKSDLTQKGPIYTTLREIKL